MSGSTAVLWGLATDDPERLRNAAYVFERTGDGWVEQVRLVPPELGVNVAGGVVAIDGDLVAIGSLAHMATFLFERDGDSWPFAAKLVGTEVVSTDRFGCSVAIDDDVVAIGAELDVNPQRAVRSGSVFVFERDAAGEWTQTAWLFADDGDQIDEFGQSVALRDGVLVVGARLDDDVGFSSGSAYVFERDPSGGWTQVAKLLPDQGAFSQMFGFSVATDGTTVVVGAPVDNPLQDGSSGAAYVHACVDGAWVRTARLVPRTDDGGASDMLGTSVAVQGDTALLGAPTRGGRLQGAAFVYRRQPDGTWTQFAELKANDRARERDAEFGNAVALSGDTALIGAWLDDNENGEDAGAAYVFALGPDNNHDGVPDPCECPADLDGSGGIDLADLEQLLLNFGLVTGAQPEDGDIDDDGDVDLQDLALLLSAFGTSCP